MPRPTTAAPSNSRMMQSHFMSASLAVLSALEPIGRDRRFFARDQDHGDDDDGDADADQRVSNERRKQRRRRNFRTGLRRFPGGADASRPDAGFLRRAFSFRGL